MARTIEWGDAVLGTDLDGAGNPISSSYFFELGTFGSFDPSANPVNDWRANWKLLDTATYDDTTKHFASTATLTYNAGSSTFTSDSAPPPSAVFAEGERVYIWIYNSLDPVPGTQWGVYTNLGSTDWVIPTGPGSQQSFPQKAFMSDVTSTPFGATPSSTPNGERTPPSGQFQFQTAGFAPIPEPAGASLLAAFGLLGVVRRRRR